MYNSLKIVPYKNKKIINHNEGYSIIEYPSLIFSKGDNIMKKWYTVSFAAKLDDDDIRALQKYFYESLKNDLNISDVCALDIDRDRSYEDGIDDEDDEFDDSDPEGELAVDSPDKISLDDENAAFDSIMKQVKDDTKPCWLNSFAEKVANKVINEFMD